jgi:hypothetical protein
MKFNKSKIVLATIIAMSPFLMASSSLEVATVYAQSAVIAEWAKPSVTAMEKANLIPGALKDDADLTKNVSREEFAELITTYYNAVEKQTSIPSPSESKFTDTKNPLIVMANKLGIVGGYPDGSFKPYNNITRQEIAVMANQAEKQLTNIGQTKNVDKFSDKAKIADWAKESVGSLSNAGGIGGYPDGTFKPTNNMTKQEAIALVSNLAAKAGLIAKPTAPTPPPVVGQTKAEAQALYKATMDGFLVTGATKIPYAVDKINSFRIVENGTPFEMNGVKITKVNIEEKSGTNMTITQEGTGKSVSAYAYIYSTDGSYGNWKDAERGSTGHWWYRAVDPTTVKAVLFTDGSGNRVLVKLN